MSSYPTQKNNKTISTASQINVANRPLQKLLSGLALIFFGASLMLPFKDDSAGLSAIFTVLGYPTTILYWLFPICTLFFIRMIFRLHEIKLPILKAFILGLAMAIAVWHFYINRHGMMIGVGVALWLTSAFLIFAAAIRWRYPQGGLLISFSALIVSLWLSLLFQGVFKDGNGGHIWKSSSEITEDSNTSIEHNHVVPVAQDKVVEAPMAAVASLDALTPSALISVERDVNLYNPWSELKPPISCEAAIKRNYPVLLPPRFLEDGYEWRNYQHGDDVCNTLIYTGVRSQNQDSNFKYKITQDRRSNVYLVFGNKNGQTLFNETFPMNREQNGLQKSDYAKKLNVGFAKMVDNNGAERIDNEYVFKNDMTLNHADTLGRGCEMKPISGKSNTYQWGENGRINWRGQSVLNPQTFCSNEFAGVAHLSLNVQSPVREMDNKLHIKLFRNKDLKPLACGAVSMGMSAGDIQLWVSRQLQAESIRIEPAGEGNCMLIKVKLNDGRTLSGGGNSTGSN